MSNFTRSLGSVQSARLHGVTLFGVVAVLACSSSEHQGETQPAVGGAGAATTLPAGGRSGAASGLVGGNATAGARAGNGAGPAASGGAASGAGGANGTSTGGAASSGRGGNGLGGSSGVGTSGVGGGSAGASVDPSQAGQAGADSVPAVGTPTLFWLDVSGKVLRSDVAKFAVKTLVPSAGQGSDGIAVDLDGGHIYWTDMGVPADNDGSLERSNLDGTGVTTIVAVGDTYTPKQLKLVAEQHELYWSDREGMRVQRANLDGTGLETLYTSGQGDQDRKDASNWCVGIAVDTAGGYFYWSQKGDDTGHTGTLRRAHLAMPAGENDTTRSDVEILYDGLAAPVDIDLDLNAGLIYWDNRGDNTVNRGPIALPTGATAQTRTDRQIIVPDVTQAIGINLDHARGLVYYTDAVGDVGRSGLDGSNAEFLLKNSGAFTGIVAIDLP